MGFFQHFPVASLVSRTWPGTGSAPPCHLCAPKDPASLRWWTQRLEQLHLHPAPYGRWSLEHVGPWRNLLKKHATNLVWSVGNQEKHTIKTIARNSYMLITHNTSKQSSIGAWIGGFSWLSPWPMYRTLLQRVILPGSRLTMIFKSRCHLVLCNMAGWKIHSQWRFSCWENHFPWLIFIHFPWLCWTRGDFSPWKHIQLINQGHRKLAPRTSPEVQILAVRSPCLRWTAQFVGLVAPQWHWFNDG